MLVNFPFKRWKSSEFGHCSLSRFVINTNSSSCNSLAYFSMSCLVCNTELQRLSYCTLMITRTNFKLYILGLFALSWHKLSQTEHGLSLKDRTVASITVLSSSHECILITPHNIFIQPVSVYFLDFSYLQQKSYWTFLTSTILAK